MKIQTLCILLMVSVSMLSQERVSTQCEQTRRAMGYPAHYCHCSEEATEFFQGFEGAINDTVWFTANVADLRLGVTAYWFADCSVTMELYAYCTSKTPTMTLTVGKNAMKEMDVAQINEKLDEMGDLAEILQTAITPKLKVYPNKNADGSGSGYVYVYPYNEGPNSTCEYMLNIFNGMTFVSSAAQDIYRLNYQQMPASGKMFVRWLQKNNAPCTMNIREGSCDGPIVASHVFRDTTKVYTIDSALLTTKRQGRDSLFFEFNHAPENVGRIVFRSNPKYVTDTIDSVLCQGQMIELIDTMLTESGQYDDTLFVVRDTLAVHHYNLQVTAPDTVYDTIRVTSRQLPMLYRNQERIDRGGYGDYAFNIYEASGCVTFYYLHVEHNITYTTSNVSVELCEGKSYIYNGVTYTTDYDLRDSIWLDEDTRAWADVHIHFVAPDMEYDTVTLAPSVVHSARGYYYKPANVYVHEFGTDTFRVERRNTCTRIIALTILQGEEPEIPADTIRITVDTTLCEGKICYYDGLTIMQDTLFTYTEILDNGDWKVVTLHVTFTPATVTTDTIKVAPSIMLSESGFYYRPTNQYYREYGTYTTWFTDDADCRYGISLTIEEGEEPIAPPDTIYLTIDTTLCEGIVYTNGMMEFRVDTIVEDSLMRENGDWVYTTTIITFTDPEYYYDTMYVKLDPAPEADTFAIVQPDTCTWYRVVVYVTKKDTVTPPEEVAVEKVNNDTVAIRKRIENGIIYIERDGVIYTILGEEKKNCTKK